MQFRFNTLQVELIYRRLKLLQSVKVLFDYYNIYVCIQRKLIQIIVYLQFKKGKQIFCFLFILDNY